MRGALAAALTLALALVATLAGAQPAPLQGVPLVDHRQQPLDARALGGRPTLLHLVFTTCSTTCPTQVAELSLVHRSLPEDVRRALRVVSLSVDPLNDTPASLAAFARRLEADRPGWHFATGDVAPVHRVLDRLQALDPRRSPARPEDHRTALFLYDAAGTLRLRLGGVPVDRARLADELTQLARLSAPASTSAKTAP